MHPRAGVLTAWPSSWRRPSPTTRPASWPSRPPWWPGPPPGGWGLAASGRPSVALPFSLAVVPLAFTVPGAPVPGVPYATAEGLHRVALLLARAALSVQAAAILSGAIPAPRLVAALGLPVRLEALLRMVLRYGGVLQAEVARMLRAREARSVGPSPGLAFQGQVAGHMAAGLFVRSLDRSERVYQAMQAQSYRGREIRLAADRPPVRPVDAAFLALALGLLALAVRG